MQKPVLLWHSEVSTLTNGNKVNIFLKGFRAMLPITTGIMPFGLVMGTVASDVKLEFAQSAIMNLILFAGASQLAALDLMTKNTTSAVIILTGVIINLRFMLYSAAMSPVVQNSNVLTKFMCAYLLTDQNYTVMTAHQNKLKSKTETIEFYFGASLCMFVTWHASVTAGFVFGNVAPASLSLDFAVPLCFVALVLPTIKDFRYVAVAVFSSVVSLLLSPMPYRLGLVLTALLGIGLGIWLSQQKRRSAQ